MLRSGASLLELLNLGKYFLLLVNYFKHVTGPVITICIWYIMAAFKTTDPSKCFSTYGTDSRANKTQLFGSRPVIQDRANKAHQRFMTTCVQLCGQTTLNVWLNFTCSVTNLSLNTNQSIDQWGRGEPSEICWTYCYLVVRVGITALNSVCGFILGSLWNTSTSLSLLFLFYLYFH